MSYFQSLNHFSGIFWLCYYSCSTADVQSHPEAFALLVREIQRLSRTTLNQKIDRLKALLRSFEGHDMKSVPKAKHALYWNLVYGYDYDLDKLLRDIGGQASQLAFIEAVSA